MLAIARGTAAPIFASVMAVIAVVPTQMQMQVPEEINMYVASCAFLMACARVLLRVTFTGIGCFFGLGKFSRGSS